MENTNWRLITTQKFIAFSAGMALFVIVLLANDDGFVIIIDHANLAFHEAGHIFFGILGSTMGLYGGTLGQLVFPVITAATFWRQGSILAYALALVWGCENLINIAPPFILIFAEKQFGGRFFCGQHFFEAFQEDRLILPAAIMCGPVFQSGLSNFQNLTPDCQQHSITEWRIQSKPGNIIPHGLPFFRRPVLHQIPCGIQA